MAWRSENLNEVQTVWWEPGAVCLIDQTKLPHARDTVRCKSVEAVAAAIRELVVRGAPAIGVTAAYGMALAPIRMAHEEGKELHVFVDETRPFLQGARLTAWELREAGIPLTLITDSMAAHFMGHGPLAPEGVHAAYPAFDVTPHGLVTAIITEIGIVEQAYEKELGRLVQAG